MAATKATFDEAVLAAPLPKLVDLGAEWCGPCVAVAPVMLFEGGDVRRVLVGARSGQEYRAAIDGVLH